MHRWGAGRSRGFAFAAFRSDDRKKSVGQLVDLCEDEGLEGIEFDWEGGEEELQKSEGCMRTPSDVFLCSGFQKWQPRADGLRPLSALSKCLVNLSGVASHVYHPIMLYSVAFSQLLVQAKKQTKKRNKLVTLALHPGQEK